MDGCGLQRRQLAPGSRARSVAGGGWEVKSRSLDEFSEDERRQLGL